MSSRRLARRTSPASKVVTARRRLAFETLEARHLLAATPISVHVAGSTGTEAFQLLVDGAVVASWTNTRVLTAARVFDTFTYVNPTSVSIDRVRVAFTNDGVPAGGGSDRNLYVDGVSVGGAKFEAEASSVYSTAFWDPVAGARSPGFKKTEAMHLNGYMQFGAANSTVQILAAGATGQEQMLLQIAGETVATYNNVGGNYGGGQFFPFNFDSGRTLPISSIRVAFANDGTTAGGADKNLRVDAVILDGVRYETEGASVLSTGTVLGGSRSIGRVQKEYLHLNGYFQYGAAGTVIEIPAAGATHEEQMQLLVNGTPVATFDAIGGNYGARQYQSYIYVAPGAVPLSQVRVALTNDATTAAGDRNLRIDGVLLDGVMNQSEASDVYSTGTFVQDVGAKPGLWQTDTLHINGYLQFASGVVPGTLSLGTSLITVNEAAGTVSIPVVRTGGSGGTVGVRYTTVNASATAGSDYTGASEQLLVFAPGETSKSIVLPIADDSLNEGNETFNLAIDQTIGGASAGAPRTATITIVDNDAPPPVGTGNGLLGSYFPNTNFTTPTFQRTDATVNFDWGNTSPGGSLGSNFFAVRWSGEVEPRYAETFTFRTTTDDGVRLWVNNQLIIDFWADQTAREWTGAIALQAGQRYSIKMEYYDDTGAASAKLEWSSPSQPRQVIPQSQLYSDPPPVSENGAFSGQTLISGLSSPTSLAFDASGRMFVSEQRGVVRVYQNGTLLPTPFLDIQNQVNFVQDRGMLGVTVHPAFPSTPYVYVSYTYDPPEAGNNSGLAGRDGSGNRVARVSRFTADASTGYNTAVPGSEVVLIGTNSVWANISHPEIDSTENLSIPASGAPNGTMRDILIADSRSHTIGNVAFGPDGMLYVASGDGTSFGQVDARTLRVQDLNSLSGKMLRVDPITGKGLADNPFYNGDPDANRSKVYDYGLRNPFRFAFQPSDGTMWIGDVGWTTWEEINRGGGENFGWPYYEGGSGTSNQTGGYRDLSQAQSFYASNPDVQASVWARSHSAGAVAIVVGDFYSGNLYPASYRNALFLSDFGDMQLRVLRINANGSLNSVTALGLSVGGVVEMTMGRDGMMYYADLVNGRVGRLVFTPSSASVAGPEGGDFDANGRVDGDDFLAWQRGLGELTTADDLAEWQAGFGAGDSVAAANTSFADELGDAPFTLAMDEPDELQPATAAVEEPRVDAVYASSDEPGTANVVSVEDSASGTGLATVDPAARDDAFEMLEGDPFAWIEAI